MSVEEEELKEILKKVPRDKLAKLLKELEKEEEELEEAEEFKVLRLKITPSGRGAIAKLKKAFWAIVQKNNLDVNKSKENWVNFVAKLVEFANEIGASDKATRLTLYYTIEENAFKPVKVLVEIYEKVREEEFIP